MPCEPESQSHRNVPRLRFVALLSLLLATFIGTLLPITSADAQVRVRGYFRKDGTYVQPHYRSAPDGNPYNNWSFPGNTQIRTLARSQAATLKRTSKTTTDAIGAARLRSSTLDRVCLSHLL